MTNSNHFNNIKVEKSSLRSSFKNNINGDYKNKDDNKELYKHIKKDESMNLANTLEKEKRVTEREQTAPNKKTDKILSNLVHNDIDLNLDMDMSGNIDHLEMDKAFSDAGDIRDFNEKVEKQSLSMIDDLKMSKKIPKLPKKNLQNNLSNIDYKRIKQVMKSSKGMQNNNGHDSDSN